MLSTHPTNKLYVISLRPVVLHAPSISFSLT
jgi:hypothetical protein